MKKQTIERLTGFFKTTALITSAAAAAALVLTLLQQVDKRNADGMKRTEGASNTAESPAPFLTAGIGTTVWEQDGLPSAGAGRLFLILKEPAGEEASDVILATENGIPKAAAPLFEENRVFEKEDSGDLDCSRESEEELWEFFKSMGCTDAGAAGAVANLYAESRFIPSAKSKNFSRTKKTGGGGLAGWMCRGRFQDLYKLAETRGISWEDMSLQKEFIVQELSGTYQHVKDVLTAADDPEYAADYFCVYYEGCIVCNASEGSIAGGASEGTPESGTKDGISMITGKKYQGLSFRREMARVFYERHAAQ